MSEDARKAALEMKKSDKQARIAQIEAELAQIRSTLSEKMRVCMREYFDAGASLAEAIRTAGICATNQGNISKSRFFTKYALLFDELQKLKTTKAALASREKKRAMLWRIVKRSTDDEGLTVSGKEKYCGKTAVAAIAELNRMDGDHAAVKTESKNTIVFQDLTDEQLDERIRTLAAQLLK